MASAVRATDKQAKCESLTCKECFEWLPGKKGYKCDLSGKRRLGSMHVCQFVNSRRVKVSYPR